MREYKDFLLESAKKYMFRVRIAHDMSDECTSNVKKALEKYGLDDMGEAKRLPIQQKTFGFEHLKNPEVYVVDVVTNYPCTPQELQAVFYSAGVPGGLVMVTTPNQEVLVAPIANEAGDSKSILDKELPKSTYPQLLADLEQALATKEENKYQIKYAEKKTKNATTTNDLPQGNISPIGSKQNKISNAVK